MLDLTESLIKEYLDESLTEAIDEERKQKLQTICDALNKKYGYEHNDRFTNPNSPYYGMDVWHTVTYKPTEMWFRVAWPDYDKIEVNFSYRNLSDEDGIKKSKYCLGNCMSDLNKYGLEITGNPEIEDSEKGWFDVIITLSENINTGNNENINIQVELEERESPYYEEDKDDLAETLDYEIEENYKYFKEKGITSEFDYDIYPDDEESGDVRVYMKLTGKAKDMQEVLKTLSGGSFGEWFFDGLSAEAYWLLQDCDKNYNGSLEDMAKNNSDELRASGYTIKIVK